MTKKEINTLILLLGKLYDNTDMDNMERLRLIQDLLNNLNN